MTEKEVQLLGFKKAIEDSDPESLFYYYTYKIARGFEFISNASDEIKEGEEWYIEFFESDPPIRFYKFEEVQNLINILEKHLIK